MTHNEKDLLLKDLCARLPYGVIIEHDGILSRLDTIFMCDSISISSTSMDEKLSYNLDLDEVKPCLYPLSSMTEEQNHEYLRTCKGGNAYYPTSKSFDWFDENHFDYRGLIPLGLAIDATGLGIY